MKLYEGFARSSKHTLWDSNRHYLVDGDALTFVIREDPQLLYLSYNTGHSYTRNEEAFWIMRMYMSPEKIHERPFPGWWAENSIYLAWHVFKKW